MHGRSNPQRGAMLAAVADRVVTAVVAVVAGNIYIVVRLLLRQLGPACVRCLTFGCGCGLFGMVILLHGDTLYLCRLGTLGCEVVVDVVARHEQNDYYYIYNGLVATQLVCSSSHLTPCCANQSI